MLSLYFDESMGEIETEIKKYSMVDDYLLDKGLDKIKEILGFENLMILRFSSTQMINCELDYSKKCCDIYYMS